MIKLTKKYIGNNNQNKIKKRKIMFGKNILNGFWKACDTIFSVEKTLSRKIKQALEFLGISGITNGFTYGSFAWAIGNEIEEWLGYEASWFTAIFAGGAAFSAAIFGINNVRRECASLADKAPNRNIRKGEPARIASKILGSSVTAVSIIPFTGMAMEAFENWPASTVFVVWHSVNRLLMNDHAVRESIDKLVDFICANCSSKQTKQQRQKLLTAIEDGRKNILATGKEDDFHKITSSTAKIASLMSSSIDIEPGEKEMQKTSSKPAIVAGGVGFCLGAGTGMYLYHFSYVAAKLILNNLLKLSCNSDCLNAIAILGIVPPMILWGEDTAQVSYGLVKSLQAYHGKADAESTKDIVTKFPKLRQLEKALIIPGAMAALSETILSYSQSAYLPETLSLIVKGSAPISLTAVYCRNLVEIYRKIFDAIESSYFEDKETQQRRIFLSQTAAVSKAVVQAPAKIIDSLHHTLLRLTSNDAVEAHGDEEAAYDSQDEHSLLIHPEN